MKRAGVIVRCRFASRTQGEVELEDGLRLILVGAGLRAFLERVVGLPELPRELAKWDYIAQRVVGMRISYESSPPRAQLHDVESLGRAS